MPKKTVQFRSIDDALQSAFDEIAALRSKVDKLQGNVMATSHLNFLLFTMIKESASIEVNGLLDYITESANKIKETAPDIPQTEGFHEIMTDFVNSIRESGDQSWIPVVVRGGKGDDEN